MADAMKIHLKKNAAGKHPILGYHLSGERWRALAKKLCHKINDFYW